MCWPTRRHWRDSDLSLLATCGRTDQTRVVGGCQRRANSYDAAAKRRRLCAGLRGGIGEIQIYLYWQPVGQPIKRALLGAVNAARIVTTRLPNAVVYVLAYAAALARFRSISIGNLWDNRSNARCWGLSTPRE